MRKINDLTGKTFGIWKIVKKTNKNDNVLLVGLPPQALRAKWFYLLLCLVGIGYIVLFIIGLINEAVGFMFNIFCMCIIGVFLILIYLFDVLFVWFHHLIFLFHYY